MRTQKTQVAILILVIGFLTGLNAAAQGKMADFSGKWIIKLEKCEFGDVPKWVYPESIAIRQTTDSISQLSVGANVEGREFKQITSFSLDGKPTRVTKTDGSHQQITGVWSEDGMVLTKDVIYFPAENPTQPQFGVLQVWKLSENGKTLLVNSKREDANGKQIVKLVYEKK